MRIKAAAIGVEAVAHGVHAVAEGDVLDEDAGGVEGAHAVTSRAVIRSATCTAAEVMMSRFPA